VNATRDPGGEIDLHGFRPSDVSEIIREYLHAARASGRLEVRIVHGRGAGALARGVHALLATLPEVAAYGFATPVFGGFGATFVRLKPGTTAGDPAR
jgi:DNA-nicking Smr family endonuclease